MAADHLLGRHDAVQDRLFNPLGVKRGAPEARTVRDLITEGRKEREELRGKEAASLVEARTSRGGAALLGAALDFGYSARREV